MENTIRTELTYKDLYNAESIVMYMDSVIYVEMQDEYPYYRTYDGVNWERSEKLDEYYDSSLMLSYLKMLSPDEAITLFVLRRQEKERQRGADCK